MIYYKFLIFKLIIILDHYMQLIKVIMFNVFFGFS